MIFKIHDFLNEKGFITQNQLDVVRNIIRADEALLEFVKERRGLNW